MDIVIENEQTVQILKDLKQNGYGKLGVAIKADKSAEADHEHDSQNTAVVCPLAELVTGQLIIQSKGIVFFVDKYLFDTVSKLSIKISSENADNVIAVIVENKVIKPKEITVKRPRVLKSRNTKAKEE